MVSPPKITLTDADRLKVVDAQFQAAAQTYAALATKRADEIVSLNQKNGWSYRQIAEQIGVSPSAVANIIQRSKQTHS